MLGHLAFLAPFTTGSYVTCERLLLGTPFTAAFGAGSLPLCIQLEALAKAPGVEMKMSVDPPTAGVCFRVEMLTAPRSIRQEQRCLDAAGNGAVTLSLLPADVPHTYIILPEVQQGSRPTITTEVYALNADGTDPHDSAELSKEEDTGFKAGSASPPGCSPPPTDNRCSTVEESALEACVNDTHRLRRLYPLDCGASSCTSDAIACLVAYSKDLDDELCKDSVDEVEQCLKGVGELFIPMVIAAYLLLATASVVLLCTMLRCCCRCVCSAPLASMQEEGGVSEDEGTDADEEFTVTPLPSGVKQAAKEEEEDENELPGYVDVVEGAAVLPRAPLQTSST